MSDTRQTLLWFDAEFTDLNLEKAAIMQVALLATDMEGKRLLPQEKDINLIVKIHENQPVSEWVIKHLSDLVDHCRSEDAVERDQVDQQLTDYVKEVEGGEIPASISDRPVLAGNSIHMDHWAVRVHLPKFLQSLHYRLFDVSALKQIAQHRGLDGAVDKEDPGFIQTYGLGEPLDGAPHDALYDIHASIAEYTYYCEKLLRPY